MSAHLPNLDLTLFDGGKPAKPGEHKPRILLLYGSTRERSFSRLLVEEAARLLEHFGAETRIFNPSDDFETEAGVKSGEVTQKSRT